MITAREHMSPGTSASAAAVAAPLSLPAPRGPALVGAIASDGTTHRRRAGRLLSVIGDAGGFLGLACLFPVAILAVGIPIALAVRLLAWLLGWIAGAL
jgi:hypothetical protein